ncbi:MAG: DEAD/DEAH box helicase [Candidatus Zixiibacteriota bacterium]|nr:MAG: DEAD/DEAH box helicase [candidate division Zixibacteria bacterium]
MKRLIAHLTAPGLLRGAVFHQRLLPPREARFAAAYDGPEPVRTALELAGIERLYRHQAEALDSFRAGGNPLVVTPTASGKSLVYQLAILETLHRDPQTRVLLLFPLKALEQDQHQRLRELLTLAGLDPGCAAILDGDTPKPERDRLRAHPPNLLLTNPDMLHYGILANHRGWAGFFRDLRCVVIDELHTYRGIFGSHVLQVLRRLGRVSRFYETQPQWIAGSATIGNPLELACELTGQDFTLIERSGAPASGRHFLLLNPTESPFTLITRLLPEIVGRGYKVIAFTKSRKATELLHRWTLKDHPELESRLSSYRAGFLPEERRDIERRLHSDELSGVITTSALELGMDIGGIDVCLLLGFPGTISSMMQRAGRAGRRDRESLVVLVAGEDALDQYYMRHPEELFLRPSEAAIVDRSNADILKAHLACAAAEIPLAERESYLDEEARRHLPDMVSRRLLISGAGGKRWFPGTPHPHRQVNIRSVGTAYSIHDAGTGRQIGDIGEARLWSECHPQAVYLHRARQHLVEKIDEAARVVHARPTELDYYTMALGEKETEILARRREFPLPCGRAVEGDLKVTERVTGYQKRRLFSGELISTHELEGPPQVLITKGFWLEMDEGVQAQAEERHFHYMGSLHASEHALIALFPLEIMCDRGDVGGISMTHHPQTGTATVFLYDGYPGGLGLTRRAFEKLDRLIGRTRALIAECPCEDGCPSCVQSPRCGGGNRPLDKAGCLYLLDRLLRPADEAAAAIVPLEETLEAGIPPMIAPAVSVTPASPPVPVIRTLPEAFQGKTVLAFDLETQRSAEEVGGWGNSHLMGVSVAVTQDLHTGEFTVYREEQVDDLIEALFAADLVVGFNHKGFDYAVLSGYSGKDFSRVKSFDFIDWIRQASGGRCGLDALGKANLGHGKTASGLDALRFFREGRWEELSAYCRSDVELTADLFYLLANTGKLRVPVKGGEAREWEMRI